MLIACVVLLLLLLSLVYQMLTGEDLRRLARRELKPLLCRIQPHQRAGRYVHKVGDSYRSRCRNCGVPMEKARKTADWQIAPLAPRPGAGETLSADACADQLLSKAVPEALVPAPGPTIRRGEPGESPG